MVHFLHSSLLFHNMHQQIPLYVCTPFPDSSHCISHKLVSNVWTVFEVFSAARRLWLSFHCSNLHLVLFRWVAEKEEYKNHILSFYFLKQPTSVQSNSHILKLAVYGSKEWWRKRGAQVRGSYLLYGMRCLKNISSKYIGNYNIRSWHSHSNVNDKCFCTGSSVSAKYPHQSNTHPTWQHASNTFQVSSYQDWRIFTLWYYYNKFWDKTMMVGCCELYIYIYICIYEINPHLQGEHKSSLIYKNLLQENYRMWNTNFF